jgi:hypothetical protein
VALVSVSGWKILLERTVVLAAVERDEEGKCGQCLPDPLLHYLNCGTVWPPPQKGGPLDGNTLNRLHKVRDTRQLVEPVLTCPD